MSKRNKTFWKQVLIIVGVILFALIILDIFFKKKRSKLSDEEKLASLKKDREVFLIGIKLASKNEKWIYLISRSIIGLILLSINFIYWRFYNLNFKLSEQLNLNEAIILVYSFCAFIIAGTPTKFVKLIRVTIYNYRKRAHIGNLDIDLINNEISILEEMIKKRNEKL